MSDTTDNARKLSPVAVAILAEHGVSETEWCQWNFFGREQWYGDTCGCPDDRCVGFHHDGPYDCGCLPALLPEMIAEHRGQE